MLDQCLEKHPMDTCPITKSRTSGMPARLLDIGHCGDACIRLWGVPASSRYASDVRWASLSHCWGREPLITTTRNNLAQRQSGIAIASLSTTFQEAVYVTRALNIRYLWIDALCIIQDDNDDWTREAAKMKSVYSQAVVTIAATSSRDGAGGCYSMVNKAYFEPRSVTFQPNMMTTNSNGTSSLPALNDGSLTVYVRKRIDYGLTMNLQRPVSGKPYVHRKSAMQASIPYVYQSMPLFSRGWALQERFLSPRTLHFTVHGVFWECRTCSTHETSPLPVDHPLTKGPLGAPSSPRSLDTLWAGCDPKRFYAVWRELVEEYSVRFLTRSTDVLPAIEGIAKLFGSGSFNVRLRGATSPADGGGYVAGLWRGDLPLGLLWTGVRWDRPLERRRPYAAPTWSWASTVGDLAFSHLGTCDDEIVEIATVRSAHGTGLLNDARSGATDGHLSLDCRARPLQITYQKGGIGGWYMEYFCGDPEPEKRTRDHSESARHSQTGSRDGHWNQQTNDEAAQISEDSQDVVDRVRVQMDYAVDQPDEVDEEGVARHNHRLASGSTIYACKIVEVRPKADEPSFVACLLLKPSSRVSEAYERIGYLESNRAIAHRWFRGAEERSIQIV